MNIENIEGLQNRDIISLYEEIIESPDYISPHVCCYSSGNIPYMDWDYFPSSSQVKSWSSSSGTRANITGYSWDYVRSLCNANCSHTCTYEGYACQGYGVYYRNGWN